MYAAPIRFTTPPLEIRTIITTNVLQPLGFFDAVVGGLGVGGSRWPVVLTTYFSLAGGLLSFLGSCQCGGVLSPLAFVVARDATMTNPSGTYRDVFCPPKVTFVPQDRYHDISYCQARGGGPRLPARAAPSAFAAAPSSPAPLYSFPITTTTAAPAAFHNTTSTTAPSLPHHQHSQSIASPHPFASPRQTSSP